MTEPEVTDIQARISRLIQEASPEARELVGEVLRLERAQIHLKVPRKVAGDIVDLTEKLVK